VGVRRRSARPRGELTVRLRDGERYDLGEGDTLRQDILDIRKAASRP